MGLDIEASPISKLSLFFFPLASRSLRLWLLPIHRPALISARPKEAHQQLTVKQSIRTKADSITLQDDLNNLQAWETKWRMAFNPNMCELAIREISPRATFFMTLNSPLLIMQNITGSPSTPTWAGRPMSTTSAEKLTPQEASWVRICTVALEKSWNRHTWLCAYHLRVCFVLLGWPHRPTQEQVGKIDMVQRRAACFVMSDYRSRHSVTM